MHNSFLFQYNAPVPIGRLKRDFVVQTVTDRNQQSTSHMHICIHNNIERAVIRLAGAGAFSSNFTHQCSPFVQHMNGLDQICTLQCRANSYNICIIYNTAVCILDAIFFTHMAPALFEITNVARDNLEREK